MEDVKGFSSLLELLESNLSFEREALRRYKGFAEKASNEELRRLFLDLAIAESGHMNGLINVIRAIRDKNYAVRFLCPVCGWEITFGENPEIGAITRCRMCGVTFELIETDGDFDIRRL